jgi:N-acetyl-anhydromuramyl-L-alanine amidase AmpD
MEAPEEPGTAEAVARWFQVTDREVSAHYCIDDDSVVQCVREEDVAWGAPGANENGIHLEHAGFARQAAADWDDAYSLAVLERSAQLTAELCGRYRIPVVWLRAADLRRRRRGITGHHDVSRAFGRSDHTDPGRGFPVEPYLARVRAHLPVGRPLLRRGSRGPEVAALQRLLAAQGVLPGAEAVDGVFGPVTEDAVRAFQVRTGLEPDGIVGSRTWRALTAAAQPRAAGALASSL